MVELRVASSVTRTNSDAAISHVQNHRHGGCLIPLTWVIPRNISDVELAGTLLASGCCVKGAYSSHTTGELKAQGQTAKQFG